NLAGSLPAELGAIALAEATHQPVDREQLIAALLGHVELWIDRYIAVGIAAIVSAWHDRMAPGLAARAMIDGIAVTGELAGLDRDGALLLRGRDGEVHRIRSGNVEVIRPGAVLDH